MAWTAVPLLLLSLLHSCSLHPLSRPANWLSQCRASNLSITALEVLPGGGWDNLRNMDMGRVMNLNYSQCQTTEDGLYLLPDEVFVIPQKETGVETNSEILSSWLEVKSSTSQSINMDISYLSVLNAKFSAENQRLKTHQVKDSSTTVRVQVRNLVYAVKAYPDFTVDVRFAQQAEKIANAIENNQTKYAAYLSERMVLDYGTHVITSVDAGASLVQDDYLRSSYVADTASQTTSISMLAGFNFFDKLKFDISSKDTTQNSQLQSYQSNISYSLIQSHGGKPFYPGMTLQNWQENTRNNLVAIDRSGLPLHYFINSNTFPDMPQPTVGKVAQSVSDAVEMYYAVNTRRGCVDAESKNYNFQANVDDKSCQGPATNLSFGGVFQQCFQISPDAEPLCQALAQKNPDTGDYSCRSPYVSTLLRSEVRQEGYSQYECHDVAYKCYLVFRCHRKVCGNNYYMRTARVNTYWCADKEEAPENSGYLFGGIYGPSLVNPITKTKSCPLYFTPVKFLSDGLMICVSNDYEMATAYSVPFGGLFSCESVNQLAGNKRRCPAGFSQHLATVSDGCEILYCVQSGLFTEGQLLPIHLPPFTLPPLIGTTGGSMVAVMSEGGRSWVRVEHSKTWIEVKPENVVNFVRQLQQDSGNMTAGSKAGLTIGIICLLALLAVGGMLLVRRKRGVKRRKTYEQIDGEAQTSETAVLLPEEEAHIEA
ncbi:Macrophage-expressed gene 1 protein [Merluccius polli]|uniref:Macrophage-expressed gene 1 protein n=1 Tax=Merluccius polli TaxID=89951 RepID=A0AA47N427_MERPO|nr:Macrophage-expressed gene 1 protein [Merluccius polli]